MPVIVRELTDQSALAVALIENLQREDLNPIDQARSMSRLIDEFDLTHDEIAKALGRSRASVTNFLRLLELADGVQGRHDRRHDRHGSRASVAAARSPSSKSAFARKIARLGWSVRKVEKTVKALLEAPPSRSKPKTAIDIQTRWLERQLARELGEKVSIRPGANDDYVLQLGFADLAKLEASLQRLQDLVRQIRAARDRVRARRRPAAAIVRSYLRPLVSL